MEFIMFNTDLLEYSIVPMGAIISVYNSKCFHLKGCAKLNHSEIYHNLLIMLPKMLSRLNKQLGWGKGKKCSKWLGESSCSLK